MNRKELKALFAVADPVLQDFGRRRSTAAAYGRESLLTTLTRNLSRNKANLLLVGESGVGKSTLLYNALKKLWREDRGKDPEQTEEEATDLSAYRYWRGSASRIIAGMRYLGEWEERCEEFIQRLTAIEGIFCAENLLELLQVGGQGPTDSVGAFLLPYLQRRELRMIAEATPAEVEACRRLMPNLLDAFEIVSVPPFDEASALEVLQQLASSYAAGLKITFEPAAIRLVQRLFSRFLPYTAFPGPSARFIRLLAETKSVSKIRKSISTDDVVLLFLKQTGLPEILLRDELPLALEEIRASFDRQVIGQPAAVLAAARLVTTIKSGLTDPGRPCGVLLFCGPTGVGKTALAKTLADFCFGAGGQKDRLVRLDMSEYSSWGAAHRLLQAPEGRPAAWIERIRRQPFSVLLFDEIEKAAPEVFDVLLGLLDEGRLTDRFGRVTSFRSAIIILTSNLGSGVQATTGFSSSGAPAYDSEVAKFFRPEFFNRLDNVITFQPLNREHIEAVTRKELSDLATREGLVADGIQLTWSDRLVAFVAREGYDRRLGARPLQRALERLVVMPLARWKVENSQLRNVRLHLDLRSDEGVEGHVVVQADL